jgi:hypothetical protein
MNDKQKSWRALGLLALAMTAGAIRVGEGTDDGAMSPFTTARPSVETATRCDARLDPAWFDDCLDPEATRIAGH